MKSLYGIEQHRHGSTHRYRVKKKVDRLGECNKNKNKSARREVAPESLRRMSDGGPVVPDPMDLELKVLLVIGPTVSTDSTGGWALALLGALIGTNEPSIAPTTLGKPADA